MGKSKIRGKDLRKINYKSDKTRSLAMNIMQQHFKYLSKEEKLNILQDVLEEPEKYAKHEFLQPLAEEFLDVVETPDGTSYKLNSEPKPYTVFGKKFIDRNTLNQMDLAMQLPVAVQGALMPDAHVGYGLPIGGVLATKNAVIPYAVGLDIGCRMSLSVYDVPALFRSGDKHHIKMALQEHTHFGVRRSQQTFVDHEILERNEFKQLELLRQLHGKACDQLGTSGSGNHFVEAGTVELDDENQFGLPKGDYLGVLAHSGSRGLGATIANYYTRVAIDTCWLPKGAQQLAWLDLDSEAGQEYWLSMTLAGDYAKACHDVIHRKMAGALGLKEVARIENHHNFAWRERLDGDDDLIVHRKGATPAGAGVWGIIPGSMTAPGYIVSGKGVKDALNSAAHGAGRKMSRRKARGSITGSDMRKLLKNEGVTLIGGGVDEAPWAYKDINEIMEGQRDLVNVEGTFYPKIVRMDKN